MNKNNYIFYAIIIYIIIISILIITKPDCIYDHNNLKFKEFGYTKDKTMFPIGILSIFIAVVMAILFSFLCPSDNDNNDNKINNNQYMVGGGQIQQPIYQQPVYQQPVYQQPVYQQPIYQQPIYQQPVYQQPVYHSVPVVPVVRTMLSSEQTIPNVIYQMPQMGGQIQQYQTPQIQVPTQQIQMPKNCITQQSSNIQSNQEASNNN